MLIFNGIVEQAFLDFVKPSCGVRQLEAMSAKEFLFGARGLKLLVLRFDLKIPVERIRREALMKRSYYLDRYGRKKKRSSLSAKLPSADQPEPICENVVKEQVGVNEMEMVS